MGVLGTWVCGWLAGRALVGRWVLPDPVGLFWSDSVWQWAWRYRGSDFGTEAAWTALGASAAGWVLAAFLTLSTRPPAGRGTGLHGSSRPATAAELRRAGFFARRGVSLGFWGRPRVWWGKKSGRVIRHGGTEPVLFLGQTRSGKGQTVAPTMLSWNGPIFCVDLKGGELFHLLAGALERRGHTVMQVDPTDPRALRWNPLDEVERGQGEVIDLFRVAENLFETSSSDASMGGSFKHFKERASAVTVGLALHCMYRPGGRGSLAEVLDLATVGDEGKDVVATFRRIAEAEHDPRCHRGWVDESQLPTSTHPQVRRLMLGATRTAPQELLSVLSTVQGGLKAWFDDRIRRATEVSEFSFRETRRRGGRPAVFLTLPALDLDVLAGYARLFTYWFERTYGPRSGHVDHARSGGERVLLVLDETPQMGRSKSVPRILSLGGGAGVVTLVTAQSLSQLRSVYGSSESVSAGCPVWWVSSTEDAVLLRELEAKLGPATVARTEVSHTAGRSGSVTRRRAEQRRPLLTQGELRTLPKDQALILGPGLHPILASKRLAFEDRRTARLLGLRRLPRHGLKRLSPKRRGPKRTDLLRGEAGGATAP